jgi:hypothetical protein
MSQGPTAAIAEIRGGGAVTETDISERPLSDDYLRWLSNQPTISCMASVA